MFFCGVCRGGDENGAVIMVEMMMTTLIILCL